MVCRVDRRGDRWAWSLIVVWRSAWEWWRWWPENDDDDDHDDDDYDDDDDDDDNDDDDDDTNDTNDTNDDNDGVQQQERNDFFRTLRWAINEH